MSISLHNKIFPVSHAKKNAPQLLLEKEMEMHSSILAWRMPWTEELGGLTVHGVRKSRTQLKWLSTAPLMLYAVYANCSIILNTIMLADPFVFQNPQQEVEAKITVGFPICHPVFSILLSLVRCLSSLHISSGKAHPLSLLPLPVS